MNPADFTDKATGRLVPTLRNALAFVPAPLPPLLTLEGLVPAIARAERLLGELSGLGRTLPNPLLLIRPFMRREAVSSSRIEGTVTTLSELFLFEAKEDAEKKADRTDAREVHNYVRALEHCLKRLEELPVSLRLIREGHEILLTGVARNRGASIVPGEFKRDQNWIGAGTIANARFVPPPPAEALAAMGDLEKYINAEDVKTPLLVRLALIHYQFEAIHPFPDGNGRIGRLLVALILCAQKALPHPLLYLSPYLERNYDAYIDLMLDVSRRGAWHEWIAFFLAGVEETCRDAIEKISKLQDLQKEYRARVQRARSSALLLRLIDILFEHSAVTIPYAAARLDVAYNAAKNNIDRLIEHRILQPPKVTTRPMVFFAEEIIGVLSD